MQSDAFRLFYELYDYILDCTDMTKKADFMTGGSLGFTRPCQHTWSWQADDN